jgi:type II secretory pathway component PulF
MALFNYEALTKDGKQKAGTLDAPSASSVREQLSTQGLFVVKIEAATDETNQGFFRRLLVRGVSFKEKILLTKQLAILLRSGVPIVQSFELLIEQFSGRMQSILIAIKDMIREGVALAQALARYPSVFDTLYVQLVRAGEASGKLDMMLERLTVYLERKEELAKKVRGALQQPIIQLVVAFVVVGVMMVFVVPNMVKNFSQQGQELPGPTLVLKAMSDFLVSYYLFIIVFIIVAVISFLYFKSTPKGGEILDRIKLHIPLVNYLSRTNAVVQFSYTLGLLLEGGVNLAEALDIVVKSIDNRILANTISQARDKIIKQGKIAQYLKQTKIFPPIAIYLIETGEETGKLDVMLLTVARNYESDVMELTDRLTGLLGPVMLFVMAGIVGFIAVAMAMPMMKMTEGIGR